MVACFETLVSLNGNFSFIGRNFSFEPWKCGFDRRDFGFDRRGFCFAAGNNGVSLELPTPRVRIKTIGGKKTAPVPK